MENDIRQDPEIWNEDYLPIDDLIDEEQNVGDIQSKEEELVHMVLLQLFACQNRYFLSDAALESVIKILKLFLTLIGDKLSFPGFDCLLSHFPSSLFLAKKKSGAHSNTSKKYVCCTSCSSIYPSESCSKIVDGKKEGKLCSFVRFPNHPQSKFRSQCGEVLMKSICSADSKTNYLYPKKLYCYNPLIQSLQSLVNRTEIRKSILDGPVKSTNETMFDTIDGYFWKDFKDVDGQPYFDDKRNLGAILNIDWFEPFENIQHSCGVIYLAILNLPRELRFKWENIIIVGIIPGPKEPSLTVNTFLKPFVDDLLLLWSEGVLLNEDGSQAFYKFALCCISSDLPATRKCCGFLSYNATLGLFILSSFWKN